MISPYNNNQGRWRDDMPRLSKPNDLPELHGETITEYAWIAGLVIFIILILSLICGSAWIARKYAAHDAKELRAEQICAEHFNLRGQWRYQSDNELWCSSAVTGDVRVVML